MPAPRELSQQISAPPPPRSKARMQKPQGGGKCSVRILVGALGGGGGVEWLWMKLIPALKQ